MTQLLWLILAQPSPLNLNQQPIMVKDEGILVAGVRASTINCTGTAVSCTQTGTTMTLNVTGGGGGVTNVTASAPLSSSGGAAPNISLTGTVGAAQGGLGATQPTCSAGQFLTCDGSTCSCSTPSGGGGGNAVEASLVMDGAGLYSVAVTGQAWVTSTSKIVCAPLGTTADGLTPEAVAAAGLTVSVSDRSAGAGFTVRVMSPHGLAGTVRIHCLGV